MGSCPSRGRGQSRSSRSGGLDQGENGASGVAGETSSCPDSTPSPAPVVTPAPALEPTPALTPEPTPEPTPETIQPLAQKTLIKEESDPAPMVPPEGKYGRTF